jgi:hypothetical protein
LTHVGVAAEEVVVLDVVVVLGDGVEALRLAGVGNLKAHDVDPSLADRSAPHPQAVGAEDVAARVVVNPAWKVQFATGEPTWQLAVEENGKIVNAKDGALAPLAAGPHSLVLYANDSGTFDKDHRFMVLADRPDHTMVKSNVFSMQ